MFFYSIKLIKSALSQTEADIPKLKWANISKKKKKKNRFIGISTSDKSKKSFFKSWLQHKEYFPNTWPQRPIPLCYRIVAEDSGRRKIRQTGHGTFSLSLVNSKQVKTARHSYVRISPRKMSYIFGLSHFFHLLKHLEKDKPHSFLNALLRGILTSERILPAHHALETIPKNN